MRDYAELSKSVHCCVDCQCEICPRGDTPFSYIECKRKLADDTADAIEELLKENAELDNSGRVLMAAFARLKEKVPHWISVEERLPEVGIDVLVTDGSDVCISHQVRYVSPTERFTFWSRDDLDLTHWMPLPSAPKEGTE